MTTSRGQRGFTLIEVIVVLAVLGLLLGAALPLASAMIDGDRRQEVRRELAELGTALEAYWSDQTAFPASLRANGFFGVYLQSGIGGTAVVDAFGGNVDYAYSVTNDPVLGPVAKVYSRGENGVDDGAAAEEFVFTVQSAVPALQKTRARLRVIVEALANFLEAGGTVTGTWDTDRAAMGLGVEYRNDGFGRAFTLPAATLTLRSAGPDGVAGNGDDITS